MSSIIIILNPILKSEILSLYWIFFKKSNFKTEKELFVTGNSDSFPWARVWCKENLMYFGLLRLECFWVRFTLETHHNNSIMEDDAGKTVELYVPRKWLVRMNWLNMAYFLVLLYKKRRGIFVWNRLFVRHKISLTSHYTASLTFLRSRS